MGAGNCAGCHKDEYNDWAQHGHAWMYVPTGAVEPPKNLFYPLTEGVGEDEVPLNFELPHLPTDDKGNLLFTWENVRYIVGHFKEGHGGFLLADGRLYNHGHFYTLDARAL